MNYLTNNLLQHLKDGSWVFLNVKILLQTSQRISIIFYQCFDFSKQNMSHLLNGLLVDYEDSKQSLKAASVNISWPKILKNVLLVAFKHL